MNYLKVNYLQTYTKLRTQEMSFHEFMELINTVYEFGYQRGTLNGIDKCNSEINTQIQRKNNEQRTD